MDTLQPFQTPLEKLEKTIRYYKLFFKITRTKEQFTIDIYFLDKYLESRYAKNYIDASNIMRDIVRNIYENAITVKSEKLNHLVTPYFDAAMNKWGVIYKKDDKFLYCDNYFVTPDRKFKEEISSWIACAEDFTLYPTTKWNIYAFYLNRYYTKNRQDGCLVAKAIEKEPIVSTV